MKRGSQRGRYDIVYYSPDFESRIQWSTKPGVHMNGAELVASLRTRIEQIEALDRTYVTTKPETQTDGPTHASQ